MHYEAWGNNFTDTPNAIEEKQKNTHSIRLPKYCNHKQDTHTKYKDSKEEETGQQNPDQSVKPLPMHLGNSSTLGTFAGRHST